MTLYNDYSNEVAGAIYRTSQESDLPKLKKILSKIPLVQPAREIVYTVCRLGHEDEFSFLFQLFLDYKREIRFWNPFSVVSRISDLASPHHLPVLKEIVKADDFWTYYKEQDRPENRMPIENYGNAYFIKRLAGTAFGKVAKRKEITLIYEMLEHDYWIIRNAAMNAIKKYGTVDDLGKLVQMAIDSRESKEGLVEAICTIDDKINPI